MKEIFYLSLFISLTSCSPNFYLPNAQHVPGFTKKGEEKISGQVLVDPSGELYGADVQYAFTVNNNNAVLLNAAGYFSSKSKEADTAPTNEFINLDLDIFDDDGGSGQGIEVGYGYFTKVKNKHSFEVYGFAGIAVFSNNTSYDDEGGFKGNMFRTSIQPSYTMKSKLMEFALSSRVCGIHYFNIRGQFEGYDELLRSKGGFYFFEPALTLKIGKKNVQFQLQYQHSFLLNQSGITTFQYMPVNFGAGVNVKI